MLTSKKSIESSNSHKQSSKLWNLAGQGAILTLLFAMTPSNAATVDIADIPLYLGGQTKPNIMYVLDDSGSMHFEVMPGELIRLYGRFVYPRATSVYGGGDYYNVVPVFDDTSGYNAITRSPDFNKVYYNPDVTYTPWVKSDGSLYPDATPTAAYHNPENTGVGTRDLTTDNTQEAYWYECTDSDPANCYYQDDAGDYYFSKTFFPAVYFEYDGSGDSWDVSSYTKVEIKPASEGGSDSYTRTTDRTDCAAAPVCTYDEEIQNFANWYQYYRSRVLTARAGSGAAFAQLAEPTDPTVATRVGFGTINKSSESIDGVNTGTIVTGARPFSGTDRDNFFTELYTRTIPASGTPLRRALDDIGQYYSRTDNKGPWSETPGTAGGDDISCRQSYTILTTDGYWSEGTSYDANTAGARANVDGTDGSEITGTEGKSYTYQADSPFEDSVSDTLADVAMYYWSRDINTSLTNDVPTNPQDPAFWQHMVTMGVSLGVTGTKDPDDAFAAIDDDSVTFTWPSPFSGEEEKIDDLLHASVNSRGKFFSAQDPKEFADGLIGAINEVTGRTSSASAIATNSTRLDANTFIYQAKYDSADWSGRLIAYQINSDGSVGASQWDAALTIPSHTNRDIYTHDGSSGVEFQWADISASQQTALGSEDILNYIRGDQSNEVKNGGSYRNRTYLLGDIVNSDPWYVGESNFGYSLLDEQEGDSYLDFLSNTVKTRTNVVYVGSNDGMLHAYNALTGAELFNYIPSAVISNLPDLADTTYTHQYYVDASPRAGDAYIDVGNGDEWRTVLVSGTGAGGRSIFALDVTEPSNFTAAEIMWEFTDTELGYTIGQPTVVRLANGEWGAVFGNGYNSDSQTARIFIVNVEDGSLIAELDTEVGDSTTPNGMATPLVVDIEGDRIADYIYAGDLHGNMWRFDISDSNSSKWDSAYSQGNTPEPLFTAVGPNGEIQPITAKPQAANHSEGGLMIYFGTGKYFEVGDNIVPTATTPAVMSFYGIHDNGAQVERADLLQQEIFYEDTGTFTHPTSGDTFDWDIRLVTDNAISSELGWYMDLISPPPANYGEQGERVVSAPLVWGDRVIFTTLIPNEDPCSWGGTSWLMEVDPEDGGRLDFTVFDLNQDGSFSDAEFVTVTDPNDPSKTITIPVSGKKSKEGIIKTPGVVCADAACYKYSSGSSGDVEVTSNKGTTNTGRQSWQQLK